jgi:long-chain fatty acid transport protein
MFSVGVAANISYGMFDMKRPLDATGEGMMDSQYEESSTGIGFSGSVGVMIKPIDILSIGLSFKTENKIAFEGTAKNEALKAANAYESDFKRDMAWPLWFGGGVAVKPFKGLTVAVDVDWSQWSKTEDEIVTDYGNATWMAALSEDSKKLKMHWKDCMQIRAGVQYEVDECIAVRCGFYTDPAPAPDETLNIIFPSISYNAICIGGSYKFSSFNVDLGLEYLMGEDRVVPFNPLDAAWRVKYKDAIPGTHGMNIFSASLGVSYTMGE